MYSSSVTHQAHANRLNYEHEVLFHHWSLLKADVYCSACSLSMCCAAFSISPINRTVATSFINRYQELIRLQTPTGGELLAPCRSTIWYLRRCNYCTWWHWTSYFIKEAAKGCVQCAQLATNQTILRLLDSTNSSTAANFAAIFPVSLEALTLISQGYCIRRPDLIELKLSCLNVCKMR